MQSAPWESTYLGGAPCPLLALRRRPGPHRPAPPPAGSSAGPRLALLGLGLPLGSHPSRCCSSFPFGFTRAGTRPSPPPPWMPSRRRCRCLNWTRRMPWTEPSKPKRTRRQRRRGASRSAPRVLARLALGHKFFQTVSLRFLFYKYLADPSPAPHLLPSRTG